MIAESGRLIVWKSLHPTGSNPRNVIVEESLAVHRTHLPDFFCGRSCDEGWGYPVNKTQTLLSLLLFKMSFRKFAFTDVN